MNKVLKDPIAVKERVNKSPKEWAFNAPCYDNRTSCSMSAGNDYGVGFRTPVGMEQPRSIEAGPIPQQAHAFSPEEIFYGKSPEDSKG